LDLVRKKRPFLVTVDEKEYKKSWGLEKLDLELTGK